MSEAEYIIECDNLVKIYKTDETEVMALQGLDCKVQRGELMAIIGNSGSGKSTFLNLLTGESGEPYDGLIDRGESLKIGYYKQTGIEFDPDETVLEVVNDTRLLGRFLFPHDMLSTRVSKLSGGEKRRLYLLTILMKEPNLLILDEPTNDLDIVTLNILEEYLKEFKGSLLIVSHDRHFLDRVTDHLLVFCGDGVVKDFIGNFSEYRAYIKDYERGLQQAEEKKEKAAAAPAPVKADKPRRLTWKEQRELEALEAELPQLEEEKSTLEQKMSSGSLPYDELQAASRRIEELMALIDEKEMRWLELQD